MPLSRLVTRTIEGICRVRWAAVRVALVVGLAVGGRLAVEARAIPRGDAGFDVVEFFLRRVGDAVDLVGRADLVGAALGHALPLLPDEPQAASDAASNRTAAAWTNGQGCRTRADYG